MLVFAAKVVTNGLEIVSVINTSFIILLSQILCVDEIK